MNIIDFSYYRVSFLIIMLFMQPLSALADLSQIEMCQLSDNPHDTYVYCNQKHIADLITKITEFDKDQNSPVWQLKKHIENGYSIAKQDAVLEVLGYIEKIVQKNFSNDQVEKINAILNNIAEQVTDNLIVDMESIQNKALCNKKIKVNDKVIFKNDVKFEKHAEFKHFTAFHGNVKFRQDVTIDGTLSATDEVVGCDLTVGCNINMNNSTDLAHGNILKNGAQFIHNFGDNNTFVGISAGNFSMTGEENTGIGIDVLHLNTSGSSNTGLGYIALQDNQNGSNNTALGASALASNTSGSSNSAIGFNAMISNQSGENNTVVGSGALQANLSGNDNIAIGGAALELNVNGSGNIALGFTAGSLLTSGDDNIYIGNDGIVSETGRIRIGTFATHLATFIQGIFGTPVGGTGLPVEIDINGQLGTAVSSKKFKKNIADMTINSEDIYKLRPVTFTYNNDESAAIQYGLIAEEVAQLFPSLVVYDLDGNPYSIRYQVLPTLLLNEMQKQHICIQQQNNNIQALTERVTRLEECV